MFVNDYRKWDKILYLFLFEKHGNKFKINDDNLILGVYYDAKV